MTTGVQGGKQSRGAAAVESAARQELWRRACGTEVVLAVGGGLAVGRRLP